MKRQDQRYLVRFILDSETAYNYEVFATTEREALVIAKYRAGIDRVPVLECKVEVR